jgi:tetratricopeptide (TPR) repeat protein
MPRDMRNPLDSTAGALQQAQILAQAGDLAGAAQLCRAVVAREPSHFYALFMLGTMECALGQFDRAEKHLARAIKVEPRSTEALTSYGNILLERKRHKEAVAVLSDAIRVQPQNVNALLYRGLGYAELGQHEQALKDFERVLQHDPRSAFGLHNRANALMALNRYSEARSSIEALLRVAPRYVPGFINHALLLSHEKKYREAVTTLDRALLIEPNNPDVFNARGNALAGMNRHKEALENYNQAARLKPDSAAFQISRGNALTALQRHEEALAAFAQASALEPSNPEVHFQRANALMDQNRLTDALAACDQAIALGPTYAPAMLLRANLLLHKDLPSEAMAAYDATIAANPDYPEGHYHRGSALLLHGRFREGWREFEYRWKVADCGFDRPGLHAREWRGEVLAGRSIVIYSEQGLGDAIQFARFLPRLVQMGAKVTFLCHPNLARLFRPFAGAIEVIASSDAIRRFDFQCALMGLAERFGIEPGDLPGAIPYLFAENDLVARWRDRIGSHGLKMGIAWQGNPIGQIDKGRSVPLEKFRALAEVPGVRLISLQKTHGLEQLTQLPPDMKVETLGSFDEGGDAFVDTAAIMQNLDLVVTSDTATPHLAGALGVPIWVALKRVPDWRWMLAGEQTPWYPTMRLFRQTTAGDWESVFSEMARALQTVMQSRSPI